MSTELQIEILDPTADDQEIEGFTESLRLALLELDVDSVSRPTTGQTPSGSKGLDLAAVGALLVALKNSVELATQVVSAVRSWMHRANGATQTLKLTMNGQTLELSAATLDQQQELVDAFIAAAAPPKQA
ncbi:MAG: hypothetical protein JWR90_3682 [Marmoricola sp.]|jgi:hypothetical protein|nr:hypothetical protein [Marmoricola sp.]